MDNSDQNRKAPIWIAMLVLPLITLGVVWILIKTESEGGCQGPVPSDGLLILLTATASIGVGWLGFQLPRSVWLSIMVGIAATATVAIFTSVAIWFELLADSGMNGCLA
jgi:hypothetical protein